MTWMMNDQPCHLNDDNMVEVLTMMQVLALFFTIAIEFLMCVLKDRVVSALTFGGATMRSSETFFVGKNHACWGHFNHEGQHFRGHSSFWESQQFSIKERFSPSKPRRWSSNTKPRWSSLKYSMVP